MFELVKMWAVIEFFGLLCLPLVITVFHNLPDRGWAFSKALGLTLFTFIVWLPLMCFPSLPYSQPFLFGALLLMLVGSIAGYLHRDTRRVIVAFVRHNPGYVLFAEGIFLVLMATLGTLRQFRPDIRSWEGFMDEGLISGIMRSPHLPPNDVWYSGYAINYYYYAHFAMATLGKLIGQAPSIVFNTGISALFALTGLNLFGITSNIVSWAKHCRMHAKVNPDEPVESASSYLPSLSGAVPFGIISLLFGVVCGNLASVQQWLSGPNIPNYYDWFGPSRVIPKTINEFPAFSFLLSDFHAHVLTLAFTILAVGVAFNLFLEDEGVGLYAFGRGWRLFLTLLVSALCLGQLFAMNGWDLPTYLLLALVAIALQQWRSYKKAFGKAFHVAYLVDVASACLSLAGLAFLLFLPFYIHYILPTGGFGKVLPEDRSSLSQELLVFGLFFFLFVSLLIVSARKRFLAQKTDREKQAKEIDQGEGEKDGEMEQEAAYRPFRFLWSSYLLGILVVVLVDIVFLGLVPNSLTFVVVGDIALLGLVLLYKQTDQALGFTILLGTLACMLIAGCELFYLRDLFEAEFPRMNTVFKFYFQAWALLSIVGGCSLFFLWERIRPALTLKVINRSAIVRLFFSFAWVVCLFLLCLAALVYPVLAPVARLSTYNARTNTLQMQPSWSLDGLNYLQNCRPPDVYTLNDSDPSTFCTFNVTADYDAIRWINANIQGDPIIVEASLSSNASSADYSLYSRVSTFTGLPTIMGWPGHEVQWRNGWLHDPNNIAAFNQRLTDINTIYTSPDNQKVLSLLHFYHAKYLFVGSMEYITYAQVNPTLNLQRFASFLHTVYNQNGVAIYEVP